MAELVDALALGASGLCPVWVRSPPLLQIKLFIMNVRVITMLNWFLNLVGTWEEEGHVRANLYQENLMTGDKFTEDAYAIKEVNSLTGDERYYIEEQDGTTNSYISERRAKDYYETWKK